MSEDSVEQARPRRNRVARWYEATRWPGLVLAGAVLLLYGPSLTAGFVLDDVRALRVFREYSEGKRAALNLYCFLPGGQATGRERDAGWYPWWVRDELRYKHFRPVAERLLYGEYQLFGERAIGFRLASLALYLAGVILVLKFFRLVALGERPARWAALVYAVASGHAIPVVFISAQCDVIALVLASGALVSAVRFVRGGKWLWLPCAVALYVSGLLAKEMVLPIAVLPLCLAYILRDTPGARRRAIVAAAALTCAGLVWLVLYAAGGYGSNAMLMLDPLHTPLAYVRALPGRAVLLLSTWLIPVNPFLFRFHHRLVEWLPVYGVVGATALVMVALLYRRWFRGDRGVAAMAVWPLVFVPLLACTPPDDRVMILPSIGFAYLGALWLTRPRADGSMRLRLVPLVLFIAAQAVTVPAAAGLMQFMEREARRHLRVMEESFGRGARPGDYIFLLNTTRNFEALFTQDRLACVDGGGPTRVSVLCDVAEPKVTALDDRTLRLESKAPPFFSSFVGLMGTARGAPWRERDVVRLAEFQVRIASVEAGAVTAMEIRFARPLTSDAYRFFWSEPEAPPRRIVLSVK